VDSGAQRELLGARVSDLGEATCVLVASSSSSQGLPLFPTGS
jgi:hypothetical protein